MFTFEDYDTAAINSEVTDLFIQARKSS